MTRTEEFLYHLPESAIAQEAIEPRDTARLLDTGTLADGTVGDLPALLDPGDLLVVNSTRVRAARLRGRKPATGGPSRCSCFGGRGMVAGRHCVGLPGGSTPG